MGRGKRSIDYPADGSPCNPLPPLPPPPFEHRDLWGVGIVYGRTLTYPLRFDVWGTREMYVSLGTARASVFFMKKTFEVKFEPLSSATSNVRLLLLCLPNRMPEVYYCVFVHDYYFLSSVNSVVLVYI